MILHRNHDDQSIHSSNQRNAGGIENGQNKDPQRAPGNQSGDELFHPIMSSSSRSAMTAMPSAWALSSFDPASSPATT